MPTMRVSGRNRTWVPTDGYLASWIFRTQRTSISFPYDYKRLIYDHTFQSTDKFQTLTLSKAALFPRWQPPEIAFPMGHLLNNLQTIQLRNIFQSSLTSPDIQKIGLPNPLKHPFNTLVGLMPLSGTADIARNFYITTGAVRGYLKCPSPLTGMKILMAGSSFAVSLTKNPISLSFPLNSLMLDITLRDSWKFTFDVMRRTELILRRSMLANSMSFSSLAKALSSFHTVGNYNFSGSFTSYPYRIEYTFHYTGSSFWKGNTYTYTYEARFYSHETINPTPYLNASLNSYNLASYNWSFQDISSSYSSFRPVSPLSMVGFNPVLNTSALNSHLHLLAPSGAGFNSLNWMGGSWY